MYYPESVTHPGEILLETLEERETNKEKQIVKDQVTKALKNVDKISAEKIVIAYEPIWAIGTGKTASSDQANEIIGYIRTIIGEIYSETEKEIIRIQYGGSVKPDNVTELMGKSDIDGALVGGASLKAEDFAKLINF